MTVVSNLIKKYRVKAGKKFNVYSGLGHPDAPEKDWFKDSSIYFGKMHSILSALRSPKLKKFVVHLYDLAKKQDVLEKQEMEKTGNNYPEEEYSHVLGTDVWFLDPKVLKNVQVLHNTGRDPHKLVKIIEDGKFRNTCINLPSANTLGFGFLKGQKDQGYYFPADVFGDNQIEFTALEAIQIYHRADANKQVIFDPDYVKNVKVIKDLSIDDDE
jgi:hypothetical protein